MRIFGWTPGTRTTNQKKRRAQLGKFICVCGPEYRMEKQYALFAQLKNGIWSIFFCCCMNCRRPRCTRRFYPMEARERARTKILNSARRKASCASLHFMQVTGNLYLFWGKCAHFSGFEAKCQCLVEFMQSILLLLLVSTLLLLLLIMMLLLMMFFLFYSVGPKILPDNDIPTNIYRIETTPEF